MASDVCARAQSALSTSPFYELRELHVEPREGHVRISGRVSSFYHKQLAQEAVGAACRELEIQVVNSIDVR
jgi:hypothetical protein